MIHMHKTRLVLNKPVYTGMTILENSKILMYDFYYNNLKSKYGQNASWSTQTPIACSWAYRQKTSTGTWNMISTCTTPATIQKTTSYLASPTKSIRQDERRVRRFSDRGSSGGEAEDVLTQESKKNIRKAKGVKKMWSKRSAHWEETIHAQNENFAEWGSRDVHVRNVYEQSAHICKSFFHEVACHGAEKEGPLGGPS